MAIFPPPDDPRHPTPHEHRPLAGARRTGRGSYEVTVSPGADVADVVAALGDVPLDAIFVEQFGDVDAVLIFLPIPPADATAVVPGGPDAPAHPELMAA